MFQGVGIHSKEKTHSARKQSVRHPELGGVSESQIRRAGRWNTDAMMGVYLSYLPPGFIRSIAGFPQEGKAYFLSRARETPEEALCSQIWPETDVWLQRMEAYHPDRTDNEGCTIRSRRFRVSTSPPCTPGGHPTGFRDLTPAVPVPPLMHGPAIQ